MYYFKNDCECFITISKHLGPDQADLIFTDAASVLTYSIHEDDSLSNIVAVWNDGIVLFEWKGNFIMTTIEIYFG